MDCKSKENEGKESKEKKEIRHSWGLQPEGSFVLAQRGGVAIYGVVVE